MVVMMMVVTVEVMVSMVTGVWMVTITTEGHGESVMSDVPMLQSRVESWVSRGVDVSFTSSNRKCFQHVENNLAF